MKTEISHIRQCSQYLDILLRNNPDYGEWLVDEKNISRKFPLTVLYSDLQREVESAESFNQLLRVFRRFKQRHFLRIGSRDLLGIADLVEATGQLSDLASVALQIGLETLSAKPHLWTSGDDLAFLDYMRGSSPIVVLGLGKLGGHELNYVSDIDLIFLDSEGEADDSGNRPVLLSRMAHWLSRLLADRFEGDRVFQVDFRLRPQGKDGILVPSMGAALDHYLLQGRAWERQMLLKCRPVAGDRSAGNAFNREVRPFVFRRFLDFQALGELREMRNMILTEALRYRPASRQFDVKLGIGGIREIEFLIQSMQLIYGGRHLELDEPNSLKCLEKLSRLRLFPENTVRELSESYIFLRRVEHYIQLDQNRQTQKLPQADDARRRLALAMGFEGDESAFTRAMEEHCSMVHSIFTGLFGEKGEDTVSPGTPGDDHVEGLDHFPEIPLARTTETFKSYSAAIGAEGLASIKGFNRRAGPEVLGKALVRLDAYFSTVARRPGLKRLFDSARPWFPDFCRGIASSELFSGLLAHNPGLVEGLALGTDSFANSADWTASAARILEKSNGYEETLEWTRRLKNERILQLVLADIAGELDFAALEEELTTLADFIIRTTFESVKLNLGLPAELPISVFGMGKLGSREMSYLSDLDLVFIYEPRFGEPEGQIPGPVIRLIQRFMNMLNTPLQEGPGYPVDARLRPTGNYGPLVVTKQSWLDYYSEDADIWEIQALLRGRHVAGHDRLGRWVETTAAGICLGGRDPDEVWPRICHLRDRMEKERSEESAASVNLKLGMGGLADIEFLVQGMLLLRGNNNLSASSLEAADTESSLGAAPWRSVRQAISELLPLDHGFQEAAGEIKAGFGALRALDHRLRLYLNSGSGKIESAQFEAMTALGLWPPRSEGSAIETWQDLLRVKREVRTVFRKYCPL